MAELRPKRLRVLLEPALSWAAILQPVPLHRARTVIRGPKVWTHLDGRDYEFRDRLRLLWRLDGYGRSPLEGDLECHLTFAGSSKGRHPRPDLSNLVKAIEDAGNPERGWGGLWGDDAQIRAIFAEISAWGPDVTPRIDLSVWRYVE